MTDTVPAQLLALKTAPIAELKQQWRSLYGTEPPVYNRRHIETRLAHRIQELAHGGLSDRTRKRLEALGDMLEKGMSLDAAKRRPDMPMTGTRLVREWQGVEHVVTVEREGFSWEGRPYKSLSAIARAITGTRWNGPLFFGLRRARRA